MEKPDFQFKYSLVNKVSIWHIFTYELSEKLHAYWLGKNNFNENLRIMQVHETQNMKNMFSRKLFQFSSYVQIYTCCAQTN